MDGSSFPQRIDNLLLWIGWFMVYGWDDLTAVVLSLYSWCGCLWHRFFRGSYCFPLRYQSSASLSDRLLTDPGIALLGMIPMRVVAFLSEWDGYFAFMDGMGYGLWLRWIRLWFSFSLLMVRLSPLLPSFKSFP
jgi:hypothetical protein